MKDIKKILFVCTGNSCRSIMAEGYFEKRLKEENIPVEVRSAGTLGIEAMPPSPESITLLKEEKISTEGYQSKALTEELIDWADLILVMEPGHKEKISLMKPGSAGKTFFLREFGDKTGNLLVPDPIGKPLTFYRYSFDIIKKSVEELIKWLKEG